jgi:hypothetical protein
MSKVHKWTGEWAVDTGDGPRFYSVSCNASLYVVEGTREYSRLWSRVSCARCRAILKKRKGRK